MKILLVCVTYNSYDSLHLYLDSIEKAALKTDCSISVHVADNSDQKEIEKQRKDYENIQVSYSNFPNLGYFGGAFSVINSLENPLEYDYILITNVDLCLDENFFVELQKIKKIDNIGWIVPDIYSVSTDTHHNPYRKKRISRKSLDVLIFLYRHPIFMYFYQNSIHFFKAKSRGMYEEREEIYAGHGSCFIFSSKFINERKFREYPCFLFGEEIFIAEELQKLNMTTWYEPSLKIFDYDHVSTSKMKKKEYYNANLQSVVYLRNTYF